MSSFLYSCLFGSAAEVLLAQPLVSLRNLPLSVPIVFLLKWALASK